MLWVQPGAGFKFYVDANQTAEFARFRVSITPRGRGNPMRLRQDSLHFVHTGLARSWLDQIRLFANARSVWARQAQRAALAGFFASVLDARSQAKGKPHERALSEGQIARLEHLVELRGTRKCTPGDLAAHLQLARGYFNRMFRAASGCSARAWLIDRRMHAAAQQLVESDRRVSEIADDFGYTSLFFFSRQFRKVLGVSPRTFRQQAMLER